MRKKHTEAMERLFRVIAQLGTDEECAAFFEDLCTIREIQDMAKRMDAAVLLDRGLSYQEVSAQAGISTGTISRVSKSLFYGSGGFRTALDRIRTAEDSGT